MASFVVDSRGEPVAVVHTQGFDREGAYILAAKRFPDSARKGELSVYWMLSNDFRMKKIREAGVEELTLENPSSTGKRTSRTQ